MERPAAEYIDFVNNFNTNIKVLTLDLWQRYQQDPMVYRAKQRIMTVVAVDPLFVIDETGPFLFKYREGIYDLERPGNDAEAFFMGSDYSEELQGAKNDELANMSAYIIRLAKDTIKLLPDAEKQQYKALVIKLLDDYVDYLDARWPPQAQPVQTAPQPAPQQQWQYQMQPWPAHQQWTAQPAQQQSGWGQPQQWS